MKLKLKLKYLVAIIILAPLMLLLTDAELISCPQGYTYVSVPVMINGCEFTVNYCVRCPTGPIPASIIITSIRMPSPPCQHGLTLRQILNYIRNISQTFQFIQQNFCSGVWVPPCDFQSQEIEIREYLCWNITKINYLGTIMYQYAPCSYDDVCVTRYTLCWDAILGEYRKTILQTYMQGGLNCSIEPEDIMLPTELNEPTECFKFPTECNP